MLRTRHSALLFREIRGFLLIKEKKWTNGFLSFLLLSDSLFTVNIIELLSVSNLQHSYVGTSCIMPMKCPFLLFISIYFIGFMVFFIVLTGGLFDLCKLKFNGIPLVLL